VQRPILQSRPRNLQHFECDPRHFDVPHVCILGLALGRIEHVVGGEQVAVLAFLALVEGPGVRANGDRQDT